MTPAQRIVLDFVRDYHDQHGYSPSYREIARQLGHRAPSTSHRIVHQLIDRGYLSIDADSTRGRVLIADQNAFASLASVPTSMLLAELKVRGVAHG